MHSNARVSYMALTVSYGLIRKGFHMRNATVSRYDFKTHESIQIPVLMCDKALISVLSGFAAMYVWPVYMYKDLKYFEIKCKKNLQSDWYEDDIGNRRHLIDYVFT